MHHTIYEIQGKRFVCLEHSLVSTETLKLNGLGILYKQFFASQGVTLKHLNWPRMLKMEKRTARDEYVLSKFKGMVRPKIQRVRFYD